MANVKKQLDQVANFMKVAGQTINTKPTPVSFGVSKLRYNLIIEEITGRNEFQYCSERDDLVGMLDGLCDILYVVYGAALTFGVNIEYNENAPNVANGTLAPANVTIDTYKNMIYWNNQFVYGFETGDMLVVETSLTNIVKSAYSYAKTIAVNLDGAFNEVHCSNMSKFSPSKEHALQSIEKRLIDGDEKYRNTYVDNCVVDGVTYWMIKRNEDGKILKSTNFFEPNLAKYVK